MNTEGTQKIIITAGSHKLPADLTLPRDARSIIVFCRVGADCRHNSQDNGIAARLQQAGFGTLLPDLLTESEALSGGEFNIDLVAGRLVEVTRWLRHADRFGRYRLGYYAVTIGAAAAIKAAVTLEETIGAIVCRSGRPDLAITVIPELSSPILLIVGSLDRYVAHLNRDVLEEFSCPRKLEIVQGATHLFTNDTMHEVATLAEAWFKVYLEPARVLNHI